MRRCAVYMCRENSACNAAKMFVFVSPMVAHVYRTRKYRITVCEGGENACLYQWARLQNE